jgi:hypothetical protein
MDEDPDPPSRCHLPFDRLMALSKSKGCVAFPSSAVACYGGRAVASPCGVLLIRLSSALLPHTAAGSAMRRLTSNTLLVPRVDPKSTAIVDQMEI